MNPPSNNNNGRTPFFLPSNKPVDVVPPTFEGASPTPAAAAATTPISVTDLELAGLSVGGSGAGGRDPDATTASAAAAAVPISVGLAAVERSESPTKAILRNCILLWTEEARKLRQRIEVLEQALEECRRTHVVVVAPAAGRHHERPSPSSSGPPRPPPSFSKSKD